MLNSFLNSGFRKIYDNFILVCDIELFQAYQSYSWDPDTCSSKKKNNQTKTKKIIAICCVILDILCIIKFRKIYANNTAIVATSGAERTKRRQEKIMIIQVIVRLKRQKVSNLTPDL